MEVFSNLVLLTKAKHRSRFILELTAFRVMWAANWMFSVLEVIIKLTVHCVLLAILESTAYRVICVVKCVLSAESMGSGAWW